VDVVVVVVSDVVNIANVVSDDFDDNEHHEAFVDVENYDCEVVQLRSNIFKQIRAVTSSSDKSS
jgi:hypothetical protein